MLSNLPGFDHTQYSRHFLKEDMPRIRYANPNLNIEVSKLPRTVGDTWKPEMVLEFRMFHISFSNVAYSSDRLL